MPTRVYTQSSGSPAVTPSTWIFANQINPVSVPGTLQKNTGSAMTSKAEATGTTSPTTRAMGRTILGPLAAQTISGTVKGQMRGAESNAGANATLALAIKIVQPNGADRGVLLAQTAADSATAGNELVLTTLTNAQFKDAAESASITLTSQAAQAGDYLVIEWGFRSATTTSRTITLSYGNDSATDLPENTSETAANNPWWEFSGTVTVETLVAVTQATESTSVQAVSVNPLTRLVSQGVTTDRARIMLGLPNLGYAFSAATSVTILGTEHGIETDALLAQVYDNATPAHQIRPGSLTVHATTYDVGLGFAQPQSGYVVLSGGQSPLDRGHYALSFTNQTSVTVSGATHGFVTKHLLVWIYDNQTPRKVVDASVTVHPTTYEVIATFTQPQSGHLVIGGYANANLTPNVSQGFTDQTTVTVLGATHGLGTANLLPQIWSADTPRRLVVPGAVTVHPTTFDLTVTFAQAQSGLLVFNGSARGLLVAVGQATESASAQTVVWAPQHRTVLQAMESALSQAITWNPQHRLVALGAELDTGQAVLWHRHIVTGQAAEQAAGQAVTWSPQHRLVSQGLESDVGQAVLWNPQHRLVLQANETVLSQTVMWSPKYRLVVQALTTDIGQAVVWSPQHRLVVQSLETALGQAVSMVSAGVVTQALEAAIADSVTSLKTLGLAATSEASLSQALAVLKTVVVAVGAEDALAQTVTWNPQARLVALAMQAEESQVVAWNPQARLVIFGQEVTSLQVVQWSPQHRQVAASLESSLAEGIAAPGGALISQSVESDTSQGLLWAPQHRLVTLATETGLAQGLTVPLIRLLGRGEEASSAQAMLWAPQHRLVVLASSSESGQSLTMVPIRLLLQASELLLSQPVQWSPLTRLIVQGLESATAQSMQWAPQHRLVGLGMEGDSAHDMLTAGNVLVQAATEEVQALLLRWAPKIRVVAPGEESAGAMATLLNPFARLILPCLEATAAQEAVEQPRTRLVRTAEEFVLSQALQGLKTQGITQATESALAEMVAATRVVPVAPSMSSDLSLAVVWAPQHRLVASAMESASALLVTALANILFFGIFGTWRIEPMVAGTWDMEPMVAGTWDMEPMVAGTWRIA